MRRISITGPESCGKSTVSKHLQHVFGGLLIPEFGRIFLESKGYDYAYTGDDVVWMAKLTQSALQDASSKDQEFVFCDGDFLVYLIWYREVFGHDSSELRAMFQDLVFDQYLLMYPDLEWEPDPLRVNPFDRLRLFQLYEAELKGANFPYTVVKGFGSARFQSAEEAISFLT